MNLPEEIKAELDKFPELKEAVTKFVSKEYEDVTPLTLWFREMDSQGYPVAEFCDWDEETSDEFYSWGSNSRWSIMFDSEVLNAPLTYIEYALDLVRSI